MTISLSNVAIQAFDDEFTAVHQIMQKLSGTTRERHGIIGESFQWPIIGTTEMQPRGAAQSLVPASDVSHEPKVVSLKPYVLNLPTDIFQQAEVNADERSELIKIHALAAGRRQDQFRIDALNASATTNIVPVGYVESGAVTPSNLTVAKLRRAKFFMDQANVPAGQRFLAIGASQLASLLRDPEVTNMDFNTRALVSGTVDSYLGFKVFTFGDSGTGGLPKTGNDRTCFAWDMMSMGMAWSIDPTTNIDWSVERQTWLTVSRLQANALALLDTGIVKIVCDETL